MPIHVENEPTGEGLPDQRVRAGAELYQARHQTPDNDPDLDGSVGPGRSLYRDRPARARRAPYED